MRPPLSWRVLRVADFGAHPSADAQDNSDALEAAVEVAKEAIGDTVGAALLFAPGTYDVDRTLDISGDKRGYEGALRGHGTWLVGDQTTLRLCPSGHAEDGAPAVAFRGRPEDEAVPGDYRLEYCGMAGISLVGPGHHQGFHGLLLDNASRFKAWGLSVRDFSTGIHLRADSFGVGRENELHLGELLDNALGLWIESRFAPELERGWLNENRFHGGRWSCSSVTASHHLLLTGGLTGFTKFHGCTFGPGAVVAARLGEEPDDEGVFAGDTKISSLNGFHRCSFVGPVHIERHGASRFLACTLGTPFGTSPVLSLRATARFQGGGSQDLHAFLLGCTLHSGIAGEPIEVVGGAVSERVWGSWTQRSLRLGTVGVYNFPPSNVYPSSS